MKQITKFILTIIFCFSYFHLYSGLNRSQKNILNNYIDSISQELDITGLSVVITENGEPIYEREVGFKIIPSEITPGVKLKKGDLFRIASISKTFIATVIMQLEEEELLNLKDDVQNYLPYPLRNPYFEDDPITIEMLLTHTSSINDIDLTYSLDSIIPSKNKKYYKCFYDSKPGKEYKYCNLNYNLLGAVIENIKGKRFDQVIDEYILKPLNLNASFNINDLDSTKLVHQYRFNKNKEKYEIFDDVFKEKILPGDTTYILSESTAILSPCAALKISSNDLVKFMNMHLNGGVYKNKQFIDYQDELRMRKNYVGSHNYGYSFKEYNDLNPKKTLIGQTGGQKGSRTAMIFDPENKIGFVILTSGSKSKFLNGYGDIHKPIIQKFYSISKSKGEK